MAHNIRKDTKNKQHKLNADGNNVTTSTVGHNDISRAPRCNVKNEIIDCLDDSDQTKQIIAEQDPNMGFNDNLTEEDEIYWDNSVMDILQVECNEDSNPMEIFDDNSTNLKYKVYPIESNCAICNKIFSCQRDLVEHAKQAHSGEKSFKCQHCPTVFSKLKSVTAHFNRSHADLDSRREEANTSSEMYPTENNVALGNNGSNDDTFSNRKGKIYPIENKCAICDRTFSFQRDLVKHTQQDHPNEKVFKCLYCSTLFSKLKSVTSHYKRSHSKLKKTIICDFCNMTFFTQFLLERHRRSHTEQRPFACNQCDKTYKYKRNLLVHMKTHSKDVKSVDTNLEQEYMDEYCENDEQNLVTRDQYCANEEQNLITEDGYCEINEQSFLAEHEEEGIHISEFSSAEGDTLIKLYPFKCNECDRVYKYKKNLKSHEKTHRNNNELTETIILDDTSANGQDNVNFYNSTYFIIDELNTDSEHFEDLGEEFASANYSDEYNYEDYDTVNTQNSADDKQNECGICRKVFKCQQSVAKHLQRCHAEIDFFKCPYCDDNFYSLDSLSLHITIKKHSQKRNICEMCLKSFDRKSDLKRHVRTHTDERPYSCNICHKTFKQTNHLKRHRELNHYSPNKPLKYSCDICVRSFLLEETLQRHMVIHDRETQFPCLMCNKIFKSRYDWQRHQETHSSRKHLACEFCLKSFDNIQTLNLHLRGHTGERKYLCTVCEKNFKEKSHLINHQRSHTII